MKVSSDYSRRASAGWLAFALAALLSGLTVEAQSSGRASVVGVLGSIIYSTDGQSYLPLKGGTVLGPGTTVKVGPRSAVDLDLGRLAGVVRLTENTVLALERMVNTEPGADAAMQLELRLLQGTLLGKAEPLPPTAQFLVKVSNGIAGIDRGQFRIEARGFVVLLDGTLVFVHVPPGGEPVSYPMKAPPAIYFSPIEQLRPAPVELVREVTNQTRSKLPKK